jgi:hypothetical protein
MSLLSAFSTMTYITRKPIRMRTKAIMEISRGHWKKLLLKAYRDSIRVLLPDAVSLSLPPFCNIKHMYNENPVILRRKDTVVHCT